MLNYTARPIKENSLGFLLQVADVNICSDNVFSMFFLASSQIAYHLAIEIKEDHMHPSVSAYNTDVDEHEYMIRREVTGCRKTKGRISEFLKLSSSFRADIQEFAFRKRI